MYVYVYVCVYISSHYPLLPFPSTLSRPHLYTRFRQSTSLTPYTQPSPLTMNAHARYLPDYRNMDDPTENASIKTLYKQTMPATNMLSAGAVSMHASGLLHGTIDRRGKILREFLPENFHCFIVEDPSFLHPSIAAEKPFGRATAHLCAVSTIAVDPLRIV